MIRTLGSAFSKKKIEFWFENLILTNLSFQEFFKYIKIFLQKILILFPDPWPKKDIEKED